MINIPTAASMTILAAALCAGCATRTATAPVAAQQPGRGVYHATDALLDSVKFTRASSREAAGWCWSDKATGTLAQVAQTHVGDFEGVGVTVPADPGGVRYVSCSWHTHPWGSHVAPGPSKADLGNSMHPRLRGIAHFVLDQHGIWQYGQGRVIGMCPWKRPGVELDRARCRS